MGATARMGSGAMEQGLRDEGGTIDGMQPLPRDANSRKNKELPWLLLSSIFQFPPSSASYWPKPTKNQLARTPRNTVGGGGEWI